MVDSEKSRRSIAVAASRGQTGGGGEPSLPYTLARAHVTNSPPRAQAGIRQAGIREVKE